MTRPLLRTLAIATATCSILAAITPSAHAARIVLTDPAGDTWATSSPPEPAGSAPNTDLRRTVIVHRAQRVTVRARFVELARPRRGETISLAVRLRTNDGPKRNAFVLARRATPRGQHSLVVERNQAPVPCPGLQHSVDYAKDEIRLSIPRGCLGRPRWVQLMVAALDLREGAGDATIDDSSTTESEPTRWTRRIRKG